MNTKQIEERQREWAASTLSETDDILAAYHSLAKKLENFEDHDLEARLVATLIERLSLSLYDWGLEEGANLLLDEALRQLAEARGVQESATS